MNTIAVIEDEQILSSMLVSWLSRSTLFRVVGSAASGREGVNLCLKEQPAVVLLDVDMPDMSGFDVARILKEKLPKTRVVILSSHCDPFCVYQAGRLNLQGYIDKPSPLSVLEEALARVAEGKCYFSEQFLSVKSHRLMQPDSFHKILSPREVSVLILVSAGEADDEISRRLAISPSTVSTHRRNLRTKLNAHSDRELLAYAQKWGLVPVGPAGSHYPLFSPFVPLNDSGAGGDDGGTG